MNLRALSITLIAALVMVAGVGTGTLSAQPDSGLPRPAYGLFGGLNLNIHSAEFAKLPGIPSCCPRYEHGTGTGPSVGLFYELPLGGQTVLSLRGGYFVHSGVLTATEPTTVIVGNELQDATFEHHVDASLNSIGIEPLFGLRPIGRLTLYLGGRLGRVLTARFSQKETIIQPSDVGVFENGRRTRNDTAAEIPNAAPTEAAAIAGIGYELPLNRNRTFILQPELLFSVGLTNVTADADWRTSAVRFGVGVKYRPEAEPAKPIVAAAVPLPERPAEQPSIPDTTIPTPISGLTAGILAFGVGHDGTERPVANIRAEEFISTSLRPLLNYLFFDENSSTLPERYTRLRAGMTDSFKVDALHNLGTLPTYYHLLNIVGRRLRQHPKSTITITGCSPEQPSDEGVSPLAISRAESVRQYLADVWEVAPERMKTAARTMPQEPSNPAEADGAAENRRVEITASIPEILEPVVTTDTIRTINPPIIRFRPTVTANAGVMNWQVSATQLGKPLRQFSGIGAPPPLIDWDIEQEQQAIPRSTAMLEYQLAVEDLKGGKRLAEGELAVEQMTIQKKRTERIADREIDRYSLILFDFDRADLNDANRRIGEFIRSRIGLGATVTITGYTDRIGEAEHNQQLSAQRARATAEALSVRPEQASGRGETATLFDNDLPEGRFYSRTVAVVVETSVK